MMSRDDDVTSLSCEMEPSSVLASMWASVYSRCQTAYRFRSRPSLPVLVAYFQFAVLGLVNGTYALYSIDRFNISWCWAPNQTVGIPILLWSFQFILAGIAAHFGRRCGRRRVILVGWIIVFASTCVTALATAIFAVFPKAEENYADCFDLKTMATYVVLAHLPLFLGLACVWVNLLLLGVDVQGAVSGDQISSYYHWFYWSRNLGDLLSQVLITWLFSTQHLAVSFTVLSAFVCLCLLLHFLVSSLDAPVEAGNKPLLQVWKVVRYVIQRSVIKARRPQVITEGELQSLTTGREPPMLFDCAKSENGGQFTPEYVDQVKKFLYVLLLIGTLLGYFAVFALMTTTYTYQSERLYIPSRFTSFHVKDGNTHKHYMSFIPMTVTVSLIVLITIPLLDLVVYPCAGAYTPSIIMKVGIGLIFAFLSSGTALVVEGMRYSTALGGNKHDIKNVFQPLYGVKSASYPASSSSVLNLLPQFVFLGIAECFLNIGAFEFVSGNAPHHMQAVLMGILFAMRGLGYLIAGSVVLSQGDRSKPEFWCYFCGEEEHTANSLFAYFVMLLLLCVCVVLFIWVYASKSLKFSVRAEEQYEKMRENVFMQRCRH